MEHHEPLTNESNKTCLAVIKQDHNLIAIINSLLDSLNDKEEVLRITTEAALLRIAKRRHDEIVEVFCNYRKTHAKLSDTQTIIILRVLSYIATNFVDSIHQSTASKCIQYSITEITKINDHTTNIQNPCREILVAVGRQYCKEIMEIFLKHLEQNVVANFILMQSIGALATSNMETVPYIKPILGLILPTLASIKQDIIRQSYAYAIGRFCETFAEYQEHQRQNPNDEIPMKTGPRYEIHDEVSIIYEHLQAHWLSSREPKLTNEVLNAFAFLYHLLPVEKISDNLNKTLPGVLALYRKSLDRSAITQYLAAIIKTVLHLNPKLLFSMSDNLIGCLFDLVCVNPDYEKPQTVKGHFEVLRCFDLLAPEYGEKVIEVLLIHLRNNNERERIKSLLLMTHLSNTSEKVVHAKLPEITVILKGMVVSEKQVKVKIVLLKTVIAFIQKQFVQDNEFVTFLIRSSCPQNKTNLDYGSAEEHIEFQRACNDTMHILSSTVGTVDQMLKMEMLQCFLLYEFTGICGTLAKCLANLFAKDPELEAQVVRRENPFDENQAPDETSPLRPMSVFVRALTLLGNFNELGRNQNVLSFLKSYARCFYCQLVPLWNDKITAIQSELHAGCSGKRYLEMLVDFVQATIKDIDNHSFVESMVAEMFFQLPLYQPICSTQTAEFRIPCLDQEKRTLVKMFGVCLCHTTDEHMICNKIDLIFELAKAERVDKNAPNEEYEQPMQDYADSLGYVAVTHLDKVMAKLGSTVIDDNSVKKSNSFFSHLSFIKDSAKELEIYKMKILTLQALNVIVYRAPKEQLLHHFTETVINYLIAQFESKELFIKQLILDTLLASIDIFMTSDWEERMTGSKIRSDLHKMCLTITSDTTNEYLPIFPSIIKLSTVLVKLHAKDQVLSVNGLLDSICFYFFSNAHNLKLRSNSIDNDTQNNFLATFLNLALPEVNRFIQQVLEQQDASPASLDDVHSILEGWLKDKNSEARICACHVYNSTLAVYMKSTKIGCEGPSKFNQTGSMLGKIIPRCIDSNATVRQTAVEVLTKILEIAYIYETVTVADDRVEWLQELKKIHDEIVTDDPKEIYRIAGELARIVAQRLSSYQYVKFCKCLLGSINDPEQSSVIGASHVLKLFMHVKGAEMYHAIPELIKDCLYAVKLCEISRARAAIVKSILALTKHHPKLVSNEILSQSLPLEEHVIEYWKTLAMDPGLAGIILDNFIATVTSSCLHEQTVPDGRENEKCSVTLQPFAIVCVLGEIFKSEELKSELQARFSEIFCMLLTTLASYISLQPPLTVVVSQQNNASTVKGNRRMKGSQQEVALNPCQIVLDAFHTFLENFGMHQISVVLTVCPDLAKSTNLNSFIEILAPLGVATASEVGINSPLMKQLVTTISKYVCSPYDTQRIASTGFYAHLVPLQPCGETASVIMLNLNSSLNDPNPLVRGLSIRGMAYLCNLLKHDVAKYSEMCLTSMLKGIDDYNQNCFINIPLDSMRGLSKVLQVIDPEMFEVFQVSLAIRIRPFFENNSTELRESAILLFGDLCGLKIKQLETNTDCTAMSKTTLISESLMEQLRANFCCLLLHLCEQESMIARASKFTMKNVCVLLGTTKMNTLAQKHLIEHGQLQYSNFLKDFVKLIGEEMSQWINDFMDACLPLLRSQWPEIRGNAALLIGLLHCQNSNPRSKHMESIGVKIAALLKDESTDVKVNAAEALGYIYGEN